MGGCWLAILCLCSWSLAAPGPADDPVAEPSPEAPALVAPVLLAAPALDPVPGAAAGGTVVLSLLIDEAGRVERAELLSGEEPLASAALELAPTLRFAPAEERGEPVAVQMDWSVRFPAAPDVPPPAGPAAAEPTAPLPPEDLRGLVGAIARPAGAPVVRTLDAEAVALTPGTLGDPVRAVANLPGLSRTPLDAGWLLVRGGGPDDTGLFVDGVRVPLVYHLGGLTSVLHPGFVEQISFVPSGQDARYGHATSGVVDLRTRRPGGPLAAEAKVDLISSGVFAQAPLGARGGIAVSARRSYLDAVLDLVPGITEAESQIAPRFWDWGASAAWGDSSLLAFGYDDEIEVPNGEGDDTAFIRLGTTRVHGHQRLPLLGDALRFAPYVAREWSAIVADELTDERAATRGGARLERPDDGSGRWGWSAGLEGELGRWEMSVNDVDVGGRFGSLDPYASLRLGDARALTLGARAETLFLPDQLARVAPSGRLGLRLPLDARWTAVGDLGLYHAWPPFDVALGLPGGAYLPLSRSWGGGAGLRLDGERVEAELDGWGRALSDLAVLEDDSSLGLGRGAAFGLEGLLTLRLGPLTSRCSATLSRSLRQDEPGHPWEPYLFDQPLVLQTVLLWPLNEALTFATRFRYASGYPRDPDIEEAYDILRGETRSLEAFPDRLPAFHALDLKLSRRIPTRRWAVEGYLDLQNVYNRRVPEPAITGVTWQPIFYSYGLPILPIFGLQGSFRAL